MISKKYNCLYIHIPKTAGTSVEKLLGHFKRLERGSQDHRTIREIQKMYFDEAISLTIREGVTQLAKELRGQFRYTDRLTREELDSLFKFTFVRNPWARIYSWYRNVMRDEQHRKNRNVSDDCTFAEFLEHHSWHTELRPQLDWLRDRKGNLRMDYIGLYEDLGKCFNDISKILDINLESLPHLVKSTPVDYREHYDTKTRQYVAQRYAEEIEMFSYTFD